MHYAIVIAASCSLVVMASLGLGRFAYTVILPAMQQGLALSSTQSGLLATFNFLGFLVASGTGGAQASRWGGRRTVAIGLLLVATGLLLTGLSFSAEMAMLAQLLTGLGTGSATVVAYGIAAAWFSPAYRGRASGVITGGIGPGILATGALLPGAMVLFGWRVGWFIISAAVLAVAGVAWLALRNRPEELGLAPLGMQVDEDAAARPAPASDWREVIRSRVFLNLGLIYALFGLAYTSYATFFTLYLVREAGLSQTAAGGLWGLTAVASSIGALFWGTISDYIGRRCTLAVIFVLFICAFVGSAILHGPVGYYGAPLLFWITIFGTPTIIAAAAGDYFGDRLVYTSLGLLTLLSGAGQAIGPTVAGFLADLTGSLVSAFIIAAVFSTLALLLSLVLPSPRPLYQATSNGKLA